MNLYSVHRESESECWTVGKIGAFFTLNVWRSCSCFPSISVPATLPYKHQTVFGSIGSNQHALPSEWSVRSLKAFSWDKENLTTHSCVCSCSVKTGAAESLFETMTTCDFCAVCGSVCVCAHVFTWNRVGFGDDSARHTTNIPIHTHKHARTRIPNMSAFRAAKHTSNVPGQRKKHQWLRNVYIRLNTIWLSDPSKPSNLYRDLGLWISFVPLYSAVLHFFVHIRSTGSCQCAFCVPFSVACAQYSIITDVELVLSLIVFFINS